MAAMSKIYRVGCKDLARNFWLFRTFDVGLGKVVPRERYEKYRCRSCGKIDELAALSEPLPPGLVIPSKWDMARSTDDFIFVGTRFREVYEKEGLCGLAFYELPNDPRFWLAMPLLVETDEALAGFQYEEPRCSTCGRYREAVVGPLVRSLEIPSDPATIFSSKMWNESIVGRRVTLFGQPQVLEALKKAKLKGFEYSKAY